LFLSFGSVAADKDGSTKIDSDGTRAALEYMKKLTETFWMVVRQSCLFALTAVFFKALIGFVVAHLVPVLPDRRQRLWRGLTLVPWVMPPALSTLGWWWLYDPTYSAFNWMLDRAFGLHVAWLSEPWWARFSVILVDVWYGAPFFMIMYLAALKSVPAGLYEAADIDGANAWQKLIHVTIPMMRNVIAVTVLFSTIVTFANFDIVRVLTQGGPLNSTHLFGTYSFKLGIESGEGHRLARPPQQHVVAGGGLPHPGRAVRDLGDDRVLRPDPEGARRGGADRTRS
jgi:ABC-type sugar transport system permease subunit